MKEPENIIIKAVAGSHLYGLNTPTSDLDTRGIYLDSVDDVLNINGRQCGEMADDKQDIKFYSLGKFLKLASECNPSIMELLYLPEDAIIVKSPIYDELISHRDWFLSKKAFHTYSGYAYAQIKRAKGLNKKGNSVGKYVKEDGIQWARWALRNGRMTEEQIMRCTNSFFLKYLLKEDTNWENPGDEQLGKGYDDFCAMSHPRLKVYLMTEVNGMPFRPKPFDIVECQKFDASRVEGLDSLYRVYNHGVGFLSMEGDVSCRSISIEREKTDFAGVVKVDGRQYEEDKREYESFWTWMSERNEARYTNDWDSDGKVDWKNLMHTMRLLICAESIARDGIMKVRFEGDERQYLLGIRNGMYSYDEIIAKAEEMNGGLKEVFDKSTLPSSSDFKSINQFYIDTMKKQFRQ